MTLIEALKKHPHSTAKQLARLMKVSIPTVYRRAEAAKGQVATHYGTPIRRKTGPQPILFVLVSR